MALFPYTAFWWKEAVLCEVRTESCIRGHIYVYIQCRLILASKEFAALTNLSFVVNTQFVHCEVRSDGLHAIYISPSVQSKDISIKWPVQSFISLQIEVMILCSLALSCVLLSHCFDYGLLWLLLPLFKYPLLIPLLFFHVLFFLFRSLFCLFSCTFCLSLP